MIDAVCLEMFGFAPGATLAWLCILVAAVVLFTSELVAVIRDWREWRRLK